MRHTFFLLLFVGSACSSEPADKDTVDPILSKKDRDEDGYPEDSGDCDDGDPSVNAGAAEVCDGVDNDCDGTVDDADPDVDPSSTADWYVDFDGDGFGNPSTDTKACDPPRGDSVAYAGDCDDGDPSVNAGAAEVCDGVDNDCDGAVDAHPVDGMPVYQDADGDGFGTEDAVLVVCESKSGYVENAGDCDDGDPNVRPDADDACFDDIDNDCDGTVDERCPTELCGEITEDTTWSDVAYGYYASCDIVVHAALTIDPGVTVYFAPGTEMSVGEDSEGALSIDAADKPVTFASGASFADPDTDVAPGDWNGLRFGSQTDISATNVNGLEIQYGGGDGSPGALTISGTSLEVSSTKVFESASAGIAVLDGGSVELTGSRVYDNLGVGLQIADGASSRNLEDNVFQGNGSYPVSLPVDSAESLDASNDFWDNASPFVEVTGGTISEDNTLSALDYPYLVTDDIQVASATEPTLTVSDGVEMAFATGTSLIVGSTDGRGALLVEGTGADPALFRSAETTPASGDWEGVVFSRYALASSISHLEVTDASFGIYVDSGKAISVRDSSFTGSSTYDLACTARATSVTWIAVSYDTSHGCNP